MRKKMFGTNVRCKIPMNLQFFAEGDGGAGDLGGGAGGSAGGSGSGDAGTGAGGTQGNNDGAGAAGAPGEGKPQGFDDFLKDPKMQAEKLAKMNAEQKAQYEQQKKEKELADREAEITKRELSAQAKETLADKGLPVSLADILNYTDASTCQASIEAVEKAFQEAVAKGVEDKLKGGSPMKKAPETGGTFTREQISAMSPEEINKNWDAVQASMKNLR